MGALIQNASRNATVLAAGSLPGRTLHLFLVLQSERFTTTEDTLRSLTLLQVACLVPHMYATSAQDAWIELALRLTCFVLCCVTL